MCLGGLGLFRLIVLSPTPYIPMMTPLDSAKTALLLSGVAAGSASAGVVSFNNSGAGFLFSGNFIDEPSLSLGSLPGVVFSSGFESPQIFASGSPFPKIGVSNEFGGVSTAEVGDVVNGLRTQGSIKLFNPLNAGFEQRTGEVEGQLASQELLNPEQYVGFTIGSEDQVDVYNGWFSYSLQINEVIGEQEPMMLSGEQLAPEVAQTQQPDFELRISSVNVSDTPNEAVTVAASPVPETGTSAALLLLGGGALASRQRRKPAA